MNVWFLGDLHAGHKYRSQQHSEKMQGISIALLRTLITPPYPLTKSAKS